MKRLGAPCITALAIATCSLALLGCGNTNGKTGTCEPNPGSTKAIEKKTPSESFDKINEDTVDPQGLGPDPQEQFPIDLEADENVHVICVGKDTDGYGDAALVFAVTNNTDVDMMFGDVDSYAYVNGVVRDVRMRQQVAASEETRAMLTFVGTFDDPDFDVNNDLNDIYLNIWIFEEATGNVYFRAWYTSRRRRCDALTKQGRQHKTRDDPTGPSLVSYTSAMRAVFT